MPTTNNPEAQRLIDAAQAKCEGCRLAWRFQSSGFEHRQGRWRMTCVAQAERKQLREIAAARVLNEVRHA